MGEHQGLPFILSVNQGFGFKFGYPVYNAPYAAENTLIVTQRNFQTHYGQRKII